MMWNGRVLKQLFLWLPKIEVNGKKVGYFSREWKGKPPSMTWKEWHQVEDILLQKLTKAGLFPTNQPKSGKSVGIYIAHCVCAQNHPGFRQSRAKTRFAAYYAGFMEMRDIVYLEDQAVEKHGTRVDPKDDM